MKLSQYNIDIIERIIKEETEHMNSILTKELIAMIVPLAIIRYLEITTEDNTNGSKVHNC